MQAKVNNKHVLATNPSKLNSFKREGENFWGLFKLMLKSFYRNPRGPLFLYIVPVFFMVLFYFVLGANIQDQGAKSTLLYSYTLLPGLTILTALAPAIVGWKNSVFLKRIDSTGVKKPVFLLALWTAYFLVGLSGILSQFIIAMIIGQKSFVDSFANVNWGYFILGALFTVIIAIALATFLGGLFSNEGAMQGVVMMVYFLSIFLSGVMLSPTMYEGNEVVRIFTYLLPQKYASFLILYAQSPNGLAGKFNNMNPAHPDFTEVWQIVLGGLLYIMFFFAITNFTFKWNAKK